MADVTFQRAEYKAAQYRWRLVRDICKGSETIKAAGELYLPRPNAADISPDNRARYDAYKLRAVFYNATGRTKRSLVGAAFRITPGLKVPNELAYVTNDINGQGVSIYQQSQAVVGHIQEVGRHGLLTDYPQTGGQTTSKADQQSGKVRATTASYTAESIINWKYIKVGGRYLLSLVVLREVVDVDTEDGFGVEPVEQFRVLRLTGGFYTQEVWQGAEMSTPTFAVLDGSGLPWDEIPFQFVGSESNDSAIDDAPLYDMAEVNKGHYQNSADYEETAYLVGQPQPWMSGLNEQWRDHLEKEGIYLGARAPWLLPANGACGLLQAQPNTVAKEAMDSKEKQMVSLGARLIEQGGAAKTATEDDNDSAAEHSVLSLIVSNVSEAYTKCLGWMARFTGVTGDTIYKINQDFTRVSLDPATLTALFTAVQGGQLPESDFWQYLRDRSVINPEKSDDDIRGEIEASASSLGLDDTTGVTPNGSKPGAV